MLRNGGTRVLVRGLKSSPRFSSPRKLSTIPLSSASLPLPSCSLSLKRPQSLRITEYRPRSLAIQWYATTSGPPFDHIDAKKEAKIAGKKLEVDPEDVSTNSSVRSVFEEGQGQEEVDMLAGVKQDLVCFGYPVPCIANKRRSKLSGRPSFSVMSLAKHITLDLLVSSPTSQRPFLQFTLPGTSTMQH